MRSRSIVIWILVTALACGAGVMLARLQSRTLSPAATAFRLTALPRDGAAREFSLIDGTGRARSLSEFRGRTVLLFFGFTRCPDVCPTELFKMAKLMATLGPDAPRVQVLFVTLDPERDTSAVIRDYAASFHPGFIGLTGSAEQIDVAANAFFVARAKVATGNDYVIDHSTATYILDRTGRLRLIARMDTPIDDFVHDLRLLFEERD